MEKENIGLKTDYYIGNPTATKWSSVYFYSPQIPAIFMEKGELFAVISLSAPASFDAIKAGDLLLDQLHEQYFESEEIDTMLALERAVLGVKKRLLELLQNDDLSSQEGIDLNLLAVSLKDNILRGVKMGEAKLLGMRSNSIQEISNAFQDPDARGEIKVGSIQVLTGDKFILMTPTARLELSDEDLLEIFEKTSVEFLEGKKFDLEELISVLYFDPHFEQVSNTENFVEGAFGTPIEKEYERDVLIGEADHTATKFIDTIKLKGSDLKNKVSNFSSKIKNFQASEQGKTFQVIMGRIKDFLINLFQKIKNLFIKILKLDSGGLYLKGKGHVKQINWRLIIFLAVILIISGYLVINTIKSNKQRAATELAAKLELESITKEKETLESTVSSLIPTREREDEKTGVLNSLNDLKSQLKKVTLYEEQVSTLDSELDTLISRISRKITVTEPEVIKDLGIIENTNLSDIDISDQKIFVSDKGNGIIYEFSFSGGDMVRIAEGLESPESISYSDEGVLVFNDKYEDRALASVVLGEEPSVKRYPGINTGRLGNVTELEAYQVDDGDYRVYGVRTESKEVIQMKKNADDYGLPELRLSGNDFNRLLDMEINEGRIYVISEGQGVRRFYGQEEFQNNVKGLLNNDNWNSASAIAVDDRYIYLADNQNKRILVFMKYRREDATTIDFVAEYDLSQMTNYSDIKDLVSQRTEGALYVLLDSKIIKLNLSDLREFSY